MERPLCSTQELSRSSGRCRDRARLQEGCREKDEGHADHARVDDWAVERNGGHERDAHDREHGAVVDDPVRVAVEGDMDLLVLGTRSASEGAATCLRSWLGRSWLFRASSEIETSESERPLNESTTKWAVVPDLSISTARSHRCPAVHRRFHGVLARSSRYDFQSAAGLPDRTEPSVVIGSEVGARSASMSSRLLRRVSGTM